MKINLAVDISPEDFFDENSVEIVETMMDVVKFQQQAAIDLTQLVLEYCKEEKITKSYVFDVFEEAMNILKTQMMEE